MRNPVTAAEHALDDTSTILWAAVANFDPEDQPIIRAVIGTLDDLRDKLTGPRVRYTRFHLGRAAERIEGTYLTSRSSKTMIAIRTDDGRLHSRSTEGGGWSLERIEEQS